MYHMFVTQLKPLKEVLDSCYVCFHSLYTNRNSLLCHQHLFFLSNLTLKGNKKEGFTRYTMIIFQLNHFFMYANTFLFNFKSSEVSISIYIASRARLSSIPQFSKKLWAKGASCDFGLIFYRAWAVTDYSPSGRVKRPVNFSRPSKYGTKMQGKVSTFDFQRVGASHP